MLTSASKKEQSAKSRWEISETRESSTNANKSSTQTQEMGAGSPSTDETSATPSPSEWSDHTSSERMQIPFLPTTRFQSDSKYGPAYQISACHRHVAEELMSIDSALSNHYLRLVNDSMIWSTGFKQCKSQDCVSLFPKTIFKTTRDGHHVRVRLVNQVSTRLQSSPSANRHRIPNRKDPAFRPRRHKFSPEENLGETPSPNRLDSHVVDQTRAAINAFFADLHAWKMGSEARAKSLGYTAISSCRSSSEDLAPVIRPHPISPEPRVKQPTFRSLKTRGRFAYSSAESDEEPGTPSIAISLSDTVHREISEARIITPTVKFTNINDVSRKGVSKGELHPICSTHTYHKIKTLYRWLTDESRALKLVERALHDILQRRIFNKNETREGGLSVLHQAKSICPGLRSESPLVKRFLAVSGYHRYYKRELATGELRGHKPPVKNNTENEMQQGSGSDASHSHEEGGVRGIALMERSAVGVIGRRSVGRHAFKTFFIQNDISDLSDSESFSSFGSEILWQA